MYGTSSSILYDICVIHVCFFQNHTKSLQEKNGQTFTEVPLKNPWRTKADGCIIRHVPLVLYSDDLSGNVSKRWNKHMAFYFTLAGLPPKLANQEYNCHFLTTSNTAGALELADSLVDDLKWVTLFTSNLIMCS
jgi:hypothetical protein